MIMHVYLWIDPSGSYAIDHQRVPSPDAAIGEWSLHGDTLHISEDGDCADIVGTYRITVRGDRFDATLIEDQCGYRTSWYGEGPLWTNGWERVFIEN